MALQFFDRTRSYGGPGTAYKVVELVKTGKTTVSHIPYSSPRACEHHKHSQG